MLAKVTDVRDFESYTSRHAVVVFSAPDWCRPCKTLQPHVEKLASKLNYPVVYVNIDKAPEIARLFNVMSVPQVFEAENGVLKRALQGRTVIALERELAAD